MIVGIICIRNLSIWRPNAKISENIAKILNMMMRDSLLIAFRVFVRLLAIERRGLVGSPET